MRDVLTPIRAGHGDEATGDPAAAGAAVGAVVAGMAATITDTTFIATGTVTDFDAKAQL
jgi:hypothetical protein